MNYNISNRRIVIFIITFLYCQLSLFSQIKIAQNDFGDCIKLFDQKESVTIITSENDFTTVKKAIEMLAGDMSLVSGQDIKYDVTNSPKGNSIIIAGTIGNNVIIDKLIKRGKLDISAINEGREQYIITIVNNPVKGVSRALIIAGSDRRGTSYGILSISEKIGVSPWCWWADVPVEKQEELWIGGD